MAIQRLSSVPNEMVNLLIFTIQDKASIVLHLTGPSLTRTPTGKSRCWAVTARGYRPGRLSTSFSRLEAAPLFPRDPVMPIYPREIHRPLPPPSLAPWNQAILLSISYFPPSLPFFTQAANSLRCFRISTKPGRVSSDRKGLPRNSLLTSPSLPLKPSSPSRSTLPAHTLHWIGRSGDVPRTRPKQTINVASMVSIPISMGNEDAATGEDVRLEVAARKDCNAECSCAE